MLVAVILTMATSLADQNPYRSVRDLVQNSQRSTATPFLNLTDIVSLDMIDTSYRVIDAITNERYCKLMRQDTFLSSFSLGAASKNATPVGSSFKAQTAKDGTIHTSEADEHCYLIKLTPGMDGKTKNDLETLIELSGSKRMAGFKLGVDTEGYKICFHRNEFPLALLNSLNVIELLEQDKKIKAGGLQKEAPWGLAALSQSYVSTDTKFKGSYVFEGTGKGVTVFLIDSGITTSHPEFSGRASIGYESNSSAAYGGDCAGHGTEVASVIVGKGVGVAKEAEIVSVSALDCDGEGTNSDLVFAIQWILENRKSPAVINMSVGGEKSAIVDAAVREAIGQGIPVVVAAGNSNLDACTQSPSGVESAIVVGASTRSKQKASFSNYGKCVHIFAPGKDIVVANAKFSANGKTTKALYSLASGTSLACPFVTGVVALLLEKNASLSPEQIKKHLQSMAMQGGLDGPLYGSPNLLAQAPNPGSTIDPSSPDVPSTGGWPDQSSMSAEAIILMTVGIVAAIGLVIAVSILVLRRRRANQQQIYQ